jgi:hypothetical protein
MKEVDVNRIVRKLKAEIEARGGIVFVPPDLPDEIAEMFLREVLECPDCQAAVRKSGRDGGRKPGH